MADTIKLGGWVDVDVALAERAEAYARGPFAGAVWQFTTRHGNQWYGFITMCEEDGVPLTPYETGSNPDGSAWVRFGADIADVTAHYACTEDDVYEELMRSFDVGELMTVDVSGHEVIAEVP